MKKWYFQFVIFSGLVLGCGQRGSDSTERFPESQPDIPRPSSPSTRVEESNSADLFETKVNVDLEKVHEEEIRKLSKSAIREKNEQTIKALYRIPKFIPETTGTRKARVAAVSAEIVELLYKSIELHPVVSKKAQERYSQSGVDIGYCFGRAAYVHLALLKMGVAKDAIRKIWLMGSMLSPEFDYAFHVATAVRTLDGRWMVIDTISGRPREVRDWLNFYLPTNRHRKDLRIYYSDPSKFTGALGKYNRVQMGLDLPLNQDWYKHYFNDLLRWFRDSSLEEVGLPTDLRN